MFREEWRRSRQGKKVPHRRCDKPSEAKPVAGQTCQIETALGELREIRRQKEWARTRQTCRLPSVKVEQSADRSRHSSRQNDCCIGHTCDPGQPHRVCGDRTRDRKRENRHLSECEVPLASLRGCCRGSALAPRDVGRQVAEVLHRRGLSSRSMVTVMGPTAPWAAIRASVVDWTPAPSDSARRRMAEGGPPSAPALERESIMPPPALRLLEPAEGRADRSRRVVHVPPPERSPACRP